VSRRDHEREGPLYSLLQTSRIATGGRRYEALKLLTIMFSGKTRQAERRILSGGNQKTFLSGGAEEANWRGITNVSVRAGGKNAINPVPKSSASFETASSRQDEKSGDVAQQGGSRRKAGKAKGP